MIDIRFLRENPDVVKQNIRNKFQDAKLPLVDEVIALDEELRQNKKRADDLRANRNKVSKSIGALMGQKKFEEAEAAKKLVSEQAAELAACEAKEAELEEIKATKELFSEVKILNYPQYANPENEEERRVTMIKMAYKPHMNYPYVLTVGNGWGIPLITRLKGTVIKEGSTRFVDTVNICLDEKGLYPMLKRTELFLQAMTTHGLTKYFETVTNPVLSYTIEQDQD